MRTEMYSSFENPCYSSPSRTIASKKDFYTFFNIVCLPLIPATE